MASQNRSVKLPPDLYEVAEIRAREAGYASWNAYVCGLIRYDAMVQGDHSVTLPISHQRPEERDRVDARLLALTKSGGKGERGQFLRRLMARLETTEPGAIAEELAAP